MQPIVIHPENAEQVKAIKAFLKDLKVQFEPQPSTFPPHVIAGIEESIKQHESGQTISLQEFKEKHLAKKMNFEIKFSPKAQSTFEDIVTQLE